MVGRQSHDRLLSGGAKSPHDLADDARKRRSTGGPRLRSAQRMSDQDSLYVVEYPGYGLVKATPPGIDEPSSIRGIPTPPITEPEHSDLRAGESIGSGPACALAPEKVTPDKIVLVVPFDSLADLASKHFPFLPVRLMLRDTWNNVESLRRYAGPVEIVGAVGDTIIPIEHAKALATQVPRDWFFFIAIEGGHNDWSENDQVKIQR